MTYLGTAHADDSSVLHFPDERAVFSADILQVKRLPGGLAPTVGAWIDALTIINALDFEHALTGHALAGTKKDAADVAALSGGHLEGRRGRHRRGPQPRGDPEDAHARRLQGVRALGHDARGAHRGRLRDDQRDAACAVGRNAVNRFQGTRHSRCVGGSKDPPASANAISATTGK